MPEVLESAHGYLRQLDAIEGDHAVHVPSTLIEILKAAAIEARNDLDGRLFFKSMREKVADVRSTPIEH